jgi:hypothetical protein
MLIMTAPCSLADTNRRKQGRDIAAIAAAGNGLTILQEALL